MARVLLENLTKKFGDLIAVDNLNLEVEDKRLACFLGPSGCGKTTTLRMIAGLETPTEGNIYIGDALVNDLSTAERDIAMVFQFYAIYPGMNVFQNLAFPLRTQKVPKNEIKRRVRETAEILHISHILNKRSERLTTGEAQRVALGRAIIRRPKVYLFDEPLTNLDARLRVHMRAELKRLQRDLGQTTIYVTHDQLEAMTMADKIAVMNLGVLQQYDTPDNVYNHPKNLFVAGFMGSPSMNFIDCTFVEKDGRALLDASEFTLDVSEFGDLIRKNSTSPELILGIRPEYTSVSRKPVGGDSFEGEVYVIEPMGDESILDLKVGECLFKTIIPITFGVKVRTKLWVSFDRNQMHIFDKKTEVAIV